MIERMCKNCGRTFPQYNTLQKLCGLCQINKYAKPKKRIKRVGRIARQWINFRKDWIESHPPDNGYYYTCAICFRPVHIDDVTLDHIEPRSSRPELRFVEENIQPTHYFCNTEKGSKH